MHKAYLLCHCTHTHKCLFVYTHICHHSNITLSPTVRVNFANELNLLKCYTKKGKKMFGDGFLLGRRNFRSKNCFKNVA